MRRRERETDIMRERETTRRMERVRQMERDNKHAEKKERQRDRWIE